MVPFWNGQRMELDEETQLALALSISSAEAKEQHCPSRHSRGRQPTTTTDAELARELQRKFDAEQQRQQQQREGGGNGLSSSAPSTAHPAQQQKKEKESGRNSHHQHQHHHSHDQAPSVPASSSTRCAGCGKSLFGSLLLGGLAGPGRCVTALGRSWHADCLKCTGCGQPLGSTFTVSECGEPYHAACHKQAFHPRCAVCCDFLPRQEDGRITAHLAPVWGDKSCPKHATDGTRRCTACTRLKPTGEQWADLDDGRVLCLSCLGTVVPDTAAAQPLYDEILVFFLGMNMRLPVRPPLMLVDDSALNAASAKEGPRADGPVFHTRGLCLTEVRHKVVRTVVPGVRIPFFSAPSPMHEQQVGPSWCEVTAILVLQGLPRLLTGCILAHESMHAWLRLSGYHNLPLEVEEGLCQLMALLWLEGHAMNGRRAGQGGGSDKDASAYEEKLAAFLGNQIRTDPSLVYGEGLRAALEAFQVHGLATILAQIRHTGKLPGVG